MVAHLNKTKMICNTDATIKHITIVFILIKLCYGGNASYTPLPRDRGLMIPQES